MPPNRPWKLPVRLGLLLLMGAAAFGVSRWSAGNPGVVEPGRLYRSAQLSGPGLSRWLHSRGIRTVLNLRGPNPDQAWYRAERAATAAAGATQVDVAMASDQWMSREQLRVVVEALRTAERPMIVHCEWGAERTGLVSALAILLTPGGGLDEARQQFSARFLYLPTSDGRMMTGHLDAYQGWLASRRQPHSPDRFLEWVRGGYRPGSPGREDWPYDPYPLIVVTRPPDRTVQAANPPPPRR